MPKQMLNERKLLMKNLKRK